MQQNLGFVFPGQGSQKVGMLSELGDAYPIIRKTFSEASEVVSYDLWQLIQHDSGNTLSKTSITQPAILSSSVAIWRLWQQHGGVRPALMAGHSLGEYSAMVCSGVLGFQDAVQLVKKRGEYMQSAVPPGVGSMAVIVGLEDRAVIEACEKAAENQVVSAVNFNSPGQVVIAGHNEAVNRAADLCKEVGAKRTLPLAVSAPFHCALMKPAADEFAKVIKAVELHSPAIDVLQNYGQETTGDTELIRDNLVKQIYSPVPWVDTINQFAARGISRSFEIGPGKVLCGLIRRIQPGFEVLAVNDVASLREALLSV